MKLRRSCLSVPGNSTKMIMKSAGTAADCIVVDLEDSVPVSEKGKARDQLQDILNQIDFKQKEVAIRINSLSTEFAHRDIMKIIEIVPDAIVIPKVESAEDLIHMERMLIAIESSQKLGKTITIQAIVETARGIQSVDEISRASKRLTALIFGIGDYLADIGARVENLHEAEAICLYPRSKIIVAAVAAGIDTIDSVFPDYKDTEGLRADAKRGYAMGFNGKWVLHPDQIDIVNESFTPSMEEFRSAKELIEAYEKAKAEGKGSIAINDRMIDEANIRMARKSCAIARHLGLLDQI